VLWRERPKCRLAEGADKSELTSTRLSARVKSLPPYGITLRRRVLCAQRLLRAQPERVELVAQHAGARVGVDDARGLWRSVVENLRCASLAPSRPPAGHVLDGAGGFGDGCLPAQRVNDRDEGLQVRQQVTAGAAGQA